MVGVPPERVVDVLALVGDAVDNVPGVPGIGEKGARDLVKEFGPVEDVIANADKVKRNAYREGLKEHAEKAILSKRLVTLSLDALWLGAFVWQLRGRPILPVHDPQFDEALGDIIERGTPPRTAH